MEKKVLLCTMIIIVCCLETITAQTPKSLVVEKSSSLVRKYLRPSLTRLYITDGTKNAALAVEQLKNVKDEKFDYNDVSRTSYVMNGIPDDKKDRAVKVNEFIKLLLDKDKIANQIMHGWFPTDDQGNLSIERLITRGQYAATDNDILKSDASKRNSTLNDLGEQLIDRSYIIAYVIKDNPNMNKPDKSGEIPHYVNVIPYIYKLKFDDETRDSFYNNYYTPRGIDEMEFPVQFVMNAKSGISTQDAAGDYEDIMTLVRKVSDFQVKTPIVKTHPIRADIGKKEGVRPDKRFSVMEMRVAKNDPSKTYAKRVATVRASRHVIDNRKVAQGTVDDLTRFYQIKGRQVRPGQTLVENPDFGIALVPEYTISEASFSIEYRIGKWLNFPGVLVYLKAGIPWSKGLGGIKILSYNEDGELKNFQVFEGSIGLAKELNFMGNFVLTPSAEFGAAFAPGAKTIDWDNSSVDNHGNINLAASTSKNAKLKTYKVGAALKLGYYMTRNIQLFVNAGYNYWLKSNDFEAYQTLWSIKNNKNKLQKFQPMSFGAGFKIGF